MVKSILHRIQNNELYKNILLLITGNGIAQLIPLCIYPVLTRIYSPTDFGILAFIFSIHSIILIISTGRFDKAIILPKKNTDANTLFITGLYLAVIISILIPFIVFFGKSSIERYSDFNNLTFWLYALALTVASTGYALLINGWCTRKKLFKIIVFYSLILSISTSGLKLIFGLLEIQNGLLISFVAAQIISSLLLYIKLHGSKHAHPIIRFLKQTDRKLIKKYINFPRYNMPHALINTLSGNLPVLVLTLYFGEYLTGLFSVALTIIFKPVHIYASSVSQALSQKVIELKNTEEPIWPTIKTYLRRTFFMAIVPFIILFIVAPTLFEIVLGDTWREAGVICRWLVIWPFAVLHGGSLAFIPNVFGKQLNALVIDIIYIILRLAALATGVFLNEALLAIGLFSVVGFIVISGIVLWYRSILKSHDKNIERNL